MAEQRRKNIGNKRYDITDKCREAIVKVYGDYRTRQYNFDGKVCESKIFNNEDFGFNRIQIESPLKLSYSFSEDKLDFLTDPKKIPDALDGLNSDGEYAPIAFKIVDAIRKTDQNKIYHSENEAKTVLEKALEKDNLPTDKYIIDIILNNLSYKDENADVVLNKKGAPVPDTSKRDYENVPLVEDIDGYFAREVKPYNAAAWIDKSKTKVGYEIPFTRYFYKYQAPRSSDEIAEIISSQEASITASLKALFGERESK